MNKDQIVSLHGARRKKLASYHAAANEIRSLALAYRAQVVAVAAGQERRVEAEIAAAFAGAGVPVAAVAPGVVYDASALRVGPLRTLYQRERLRHAPGLVALEATTKGWHPDAARSPRLEALTAAVARLLACYPWGAGDESDIGGER